jgi:DNA-binding transcriptional regulator YhcF (GntR family)
MNILMKWELNSERPVYLQLMEQIQAEIISGNFKPGDKLPSVRDLAAEATVNPNTMQKALAELERVGLLLTNRTSGRYITSDDKMIQELRGEAARKHILEFIDKMHQLGFEPEETLNLFIEIVKSKQDESVN